MYWATDIDKFEISIASHILIISPKKKALFPEDLVAKTSLTRVVATKFFLHTNGNPNEKRN